MPDLNEFEFTDIHHWEQQVLKDLGLEDIREITRIQMSEGIIQSPYVDFTSSSEKRLECSYRNMVVKPEEGRNGHRTWLNLEYVCHSDPETSNTQAMEALSRGADGIVLEINKPVDHQTQFKDISLRHCYLGLQGPYDAIRDLCQYLAANQPAIKGFVSVYNLMEVIGLDRDELFPRPGFNGQFKTLVIQEPTGEYGTLEEVSRLLSQGILIINTLLEARIPLSVILKNIHFSLKIGSHYLWEICRLRSLRILFHQIIKKYGSDFPPASIPIHVFTSGPLSNLDLSTDNREAHSRLLISNTTQAMSAILGGCNSLSILPGVLEGADQVSIRRIARNVSHIVREESFFHRVSDPVAGSYYLEDLTHNMMGHIWSGLRELERTGGYQYITAQR